MLILRTWSSTSWSTLTDRCLYWGIVKLNATLAKKLLRPFFFTAQSHIKRSNIYLRKGVSQFIKSIYCQLHSFVSRLLPVFFFHFFNKIHKNFVCYKLIKKNISWEISKRIYHTNTVKVMWNKNVMKIVGTTYKPSLFLKFNSIIWYFYFKITLHISSHGYTITPPP